MSFTGKIAPKTAHWLAVLLIITVGNIPGCSSGQKKGPTDGPEPKAVREKNLSKGWNQNGSVYVWFAPGMATGHELVHGVRKKNCREHAREIAWQALATEWKREAGAAAKKAGEKGKKISLKSSAADLEKKFGDSREELSVRFDQDQNCEIWFSLKEKGLRQQILTGKL